MGMLLTAVRLMCFLPVSHSTARFVHFCTLYFGRKFMAGSDIPKVRRFKRGDRIYVQAQQIWLILISHVMSHRAQFMKTNKPKPITYGELAEMMTNHNRKASVTLSRQLGIVATYCKINGLPLLNVIVVKKATGVPGRGVVTREDRSLPKEAKAVFEEDWFQIRVPTTGTFRKLWESWEDLEEEDDSED